jgi:hypothetical protein
MFLLKYYYLDHHEIEDESLVMDLLKYCLLVVYIK